MMENETGVLVIMIGAPGCGKSTKSEELAQQGFCVICPDKIRAELTGDESDQTRNEDVFELAYSRVEDLLQDGEDVVFDATNAYNNHREKLLRRTAKYRKGAVAMVSTECLRKCLERNDNRPGRKVPEEVILRIYKRLLEHPPSLLEGFDLIVPMSISVGQLDRILCVLY